MPESSTRASSALPRRCSSSPCSCRACSASPRDAVIAALFGATGADRRLLRRLHHPRLAQLHRRRRHALHHLHPHLHAPPEGRRRGRRQPRPVDHRHRHDARWCVVGIVLLEYFTPALSASYLRKLRPEDLDLAIGLTRILLPAQLFFYLGGLASATLFSRHRFVAASMAPLLYNLGPIVGGAIFGRRYGIVVVGVGRARRRHRRPVRRHGGRRLARRHALSPVAGAARSRVPRVAAWRASRSCSASRSSPPTTGSSATSPPPTSAPSPASTTRASWCRSPSPSPARRSGRRRCRSSRSYWAEGAQKDLGDLVTRSARASAAIAALAGCALIALGEPTVDLLFRRGHFAAAQVMPTAHYVMLFAAAIPLWAMQAHPGARLLRHRRHADADGGGHAGVGDVAADLLDLVSHHRRRRAGARLRRRHLPAHRVADAAPAAAPRHRRRGATSSAARCADTVVGAVGAVPAWAAVTWLPHGRLHGHLLVVVKLAVGGLIFASLAALARAAARRQRHRRLHRGAYLAAPEAGSTFAHMTAKQREQLRESSSIS